MAERWANPPRGQTGPELHLGGIRSRTGLEVALREAVQSGRLAPDTRLPSSRTLAADLGLARNTVAEAFTQLVGEGWLEARVGSGTWVAAGAATAAVAPEAVDEAAARAPRYDLRTGAPDLSLFPRATWTAAFRRALAAAPNDALGNGDPRGRVELRRSLAIYLARARGVRTDPRRIVVCTGFTQALGLLAEVAADRGGRAVAIERFGHTGYRDVIARAGLTVHDLPLDGDGADVAALDGETAAVLTPAHQFPLGMALAAQRRPRVVAWARESGGLVVEDDYDGEFRYDRAALGAMQALGPEQVVYAGTASKSLAPGLRLSWLVVPEAWLDDVVSAKFRADRFTGALDQLALADLIDSGGFDRQIRRARLVYRRRRDRLVAALAAQVPEARVTGLAAGLHAMVDLPGDRTEQEVVERAAARGVAVEGLSAYAAEGDHGPPSLVVGYATPPEHAFTSAVARLCAALRS